MRTALLRLPDLVALRAAPDGASAPGGCWFRARPRRRADALRGGLAKN